MSDRVFEAELNAMREALSRGPQPDDIENVVPVNVPRTVFALGNWPYASLRKADLDLAWAVLSHGQKRRPKIRQFRRVNVPQIDQGVSLSSSNLLHARAVGGLRRARDPGWRGGSAKGRYAGACDRSLR